MALKGFKLSNDYELSTWLAYTSWTNHCAQQTRWMTSQVKQNIFSIFYILCIFNIFYILHIVLYQQIVHIAKHINMFDCWTAWLDHQLGCLSVHPHIYFEQWISTSSIFGSSVLHTGAAASCSSWRYRDDTLLDAKRGSKLSRGFLRQNKGLQRMLQVVVCE